jgi:magnesium chelatase subunit I
MLDARRDSENGQKSGPKNACVGDHDQHNAPRRGVSDKRPDSARRAARTFPFSAIVGQDEMRTALLLAAVDPSIGGVLVLGDRGTGKSTAVRALASLLPDIEAMADCAFGCDPKGTVLCGRARRHKLVASSARA